jgi:cellulose synthase/poly-beta-1,6-N-acetylglucosamine synthase-like glycosyltransferase
MVIETLNALTALNYPQFEVILLDNNTVNPEIWRPVEKHCKQLGERFHFYHFDTITGAKAGALNKCIQLTSPKAEIIAVFDSDYITKSDFLEKLVGYFNDPKVGFVQTCQDYRDWDQNSYQTACYYEYEPAYKLVLPGYNEWDVNYTIGTMCLIRRDVLEKVGGWAEWCLTEDSEAAVRIHAEGYTGYFLRDTYGKGLIPETFENYKLQRFRWSAGPAQQLQKHWRLYMPWGSQGKLTLIQKLGELNHSLAPLFGEIINFFIVFAILAICMWYAVVQHKHFYIPNIILFFIIATMFKNLIFSYIIIRLIGGKWKDYFLSSIASRSLIFISGMAYCRAWISNHIKWRRTDKFKTSSSVRRAISSSKPEFFAALVYFVISVVMVPFVSFWPIDVLFLIWISLLNRVITFLCAPFMAFLSEKNLEISLDSTYTRE